MFLPSRQSALLRPRPAAVRAAWVLLLAALGSAVVLIALSASPAAAHDNLVSSYQRPGSARPSMSAASSAAAATSAAAASPVEEHGDQHQGQSGLGNGWVIGGIAAVALAGGAALLVFRRRAAALPGATREDRV